MEKKNKDNKLKNKKSAAKELGLKTIKQKNGEPYLRVLALAPMNKGFGYVVTENLYRALDCGVTNIRVNKVSRSLTRFEALLREYQPDMVVCMDTERCSSTMSQKILTSVEKYCAAASRPLRRFKRDDIKHIFSNFGVITRYDIADHLIKWLPALEHVRPKRCAIWESEDPRMKIFDAAAVAIVFYAAHGVEINRTKTKK